MHRIKMLREKKNLSQAELGEIVGVGQHDISRFENGVRNPSISTLEKIATALNTTTDYLLCRDQQSSTGYRLKKGERDEKLTSV